MERRIKKIDIDLDFEDIKAEVRKNLERAVATARADTRAKLPYMRAIRAVCYTLCVCTAAVMITIMISNGSSAAFPVKDPDTIGGDQLYDPLKSESIAMKYDRFFAFTYGIDPELIINSDLLNDADKKAFSDYVSVSGNKKYSIYMGTKNGVDYIKLCESYGSGEFDFISRSDYRYEDIISEFEAISNTAIDDDYLIRSYGKQAVNNGIYIYFKKTDGEYCVYFQAVLNNKVYVIDK